MNIVSLCFLISIFLVVIYTFHKARRVHLMLYQIQDQHHKGLNNLFRQIEALQGLYLDLGFQKSLPPTREWAASPDFLSQLSTHALNVRPKVIVECSSGVSTLVLARCMKLNGTGHVYSLEHMSEYAEKTRSDLDRHGLGKWATVIDAPLMDYELRGESWPWYSIEKLDNNTDIDMLVIDGPPAKTGKLARYPAGPLLFGKLTQGASAFLDDANRDDEQAIIDHWVQEFPNLLKKIRACEKGCVVLGKS